MPGTNLSVLIDTGSTKSYINPLVAEHFFPDHFQPEPFTVRTAHGSSRGDFTTMVPCGELFKTRNLKIKFNVFQFHSKFDMLLGLDALKKIKASINLERNTLETPNVEIPLSYLGTDSADLNLIDARMVQSIKLRVSNIENGEAIFPYLKIGNVEIPESLIKIKNFETYVRVLNPQETPAKFCQISPVPVEEIGDLPTLGQFENFNHYLDEQFDREFDISKIRLDHMNEEEKVAITGLVQKYSDIFHTGNEPLTCSPKVSHHIRTTSEVPIYSRNYRFPEIYRNEVERQVEEMLEQGIVRHSESPWNAPIWIVPKKSDASGVQKFRMVIDYRGLNEVTIEDKYPLPQISDLLDRLGKCSYFSVIDLKSGFHQISMNEDSIAKTAFSTPTRHLEFLRLPFGLKNSPSTFQRMMDNVLRGIANEYACVYLDDIIIFSKSLAEHIQRLEEVFKRLRKANLKIQLDKTEFLRKEIAYLGHVVTAEGVKPNPDKIQAILKYPIPSTVREIKSFLGLLSYYRKFIKNFAKITKPMTMCLKKDAKINTSDPEYKQCFEICRQLLTNDPILQYPDFTKTFNLTTDASNVAIGAVLSQNTNGADLPVAYASRTLNDSERKLSTIEKELLAVVWGVQYFRPYLFGRKFRIFTDHRPLHWLQSIKEPSSKLFKWKTQLAAYDFEIMYKKGSLNTNADALSRIELLNNSDDITEPTSVEIDQAMDDILATLTPNTRKLLDEVNPDETCPVDLDSLGVNLDSEDEIESLGTVHSNAIGHALVAIPIKDEPINTCAHQIIVNLTKLPVENPVKVEKLFETKSRITIHLSQSNLEEETVKFVKEYILPKIKYGIYFSEDIYEQFVGILTKYFTFSEIIMTRFTKKLPDILDENKQINIIKNYHNGLTNHRGIDETHWTLKRSYYWPNMRQSIQKFINNCEVCVRTKYDRNPIKVKYNVTPTASRPLETLHMDTMTMEKTKFLTIIDPFSKFAQAYPLKSSNAIDIVDTLLKHFSLFGIPTNITTDNGPEFQNSMVREFMILHKINLHFTSSQHPESNSPIERFHSTIIEHIRILNEKEETKQDDVRKKVKYALLAYNNSIHSASGLTPFSLLYGHIDQKTLFDMNMEKTLATNYLTTHKDKMKVLYAQTHEKLSQKKERAIEKLNEDREELPEIPAEVYIRTVQKQSKTKPKYNKEIIKELDTELKTAKIVPRHHNTQEKIHISNIKRPKKFTDSTVNAWDEKLDKSEILTSKFGLRITRGDLLTLKKNQWMNDNIVNFYMELIDQRSRLNDQAPKTYCFNTFLYISFLAGGHNRVKNYTRKTDLFEKDLVIVPIFQGNHWRLVLVKIKAKLLVYFDSMNKVGRNILNQIKTYLAAEHLAKKGTPLNLSEWNCHIPTDTPQQNNSNDCGVFMCQIAKSCGANEPITVSQPQIQEFREQMCAEILNGELF